MLLTSLVSTPPSWSTHPGAAPRRASAAIAIGRYRAPPSPWTAGLVAWLLVGLIALGCMPADADGPWLGSTLPFWLVGARLINLLWLGAGHVFATQTGRRVMRSRWLHRAATRVRPPAVRTATRPTRVESR